MAIKDIVKAIIVTIKGDTTDIDSKIQETQEAITDLGKTPIPTTSFKNLKTAIREATNEAHKMRTEFGESSVQYADALKKLSELKDEVDAFQRTASAFDPGNKFSAFIGIAKAGTTAVQGYAGAMAFLGEEGKEATETLAKLQGIMALTDAINGIGDLQDYWKGFVLTIKQATVATEGQTVASRTLSVALKGIGIGLLVAALAYVVTNFKDIKKAIFEALPFLDGAGETFDQLKAGVLAFGEAVFKFAITPMKALISVVQLDFKGAVKDIEEGFNVVKNTEDAYQKNRQKQAEEAEREFQARRVKGLEYALSQYREDSKEYKVIEEELNKARLAALEYGGEEYIKEVQDQATKEAQARNKAAKEAEDKAKQASDKAIAEAKARHEKLVAENKAYLEQIKSSNENALKVINQETQSARDKELSDLQATFKKEYDLYNKKGISIENLIQSQRIQEAGINKKYDDQALQYLQEVQDKTLTTYEVSIKAINKQIDDLIKNATPAQKELLENSRNAQVDAATRLQNLSTVSMRANINLQTTQVTNQVTERDTPEQAYEKSKKVLDAQLAAETASYEYEKQMKAGQNAELEQLEGQHQNNLLSLAAQNAEAQIALDTAVKDAKLKNAATVGTALGALGALAGEQTVVGKVLGIAQATIDTYIGANKALAQGGIWGYVQAGALILQGLNNVRKIIAVKVPSPSGGGTAAASAAPSAPPITAASTAGFQGQVQDVRVVNSGQNVVKAYVTDKDLKDNEERTSFLNNLSTI